MDVVRLSGAGTIAAAVMLSLMSDLHVGRAATPFGDLHPIPPVLNAPARSDDAAMPPTALRAFSLSGPVMHTPLSPSPTVYGASLFPLPRFTPPSGSPWSKLIDEASQRFGIPAAWVRGVMRMESGGRTMIDGRPITSPAGAMGLMQVMPTTFAELSGRYGLGSDPYEPRANIMAGAAYLREMYDRYGSTYFLAAYNAGPERVDDHLRTGRALPFETQLYVQALTPQLFGTGADRVAPTSSLVHDLTSLGTLREAANASSRFRSTSPPSPEAAPLFVTMVGAPSTRDRQEVVQAGDGLFVSLARRDQRLERAPLDIPQD